MALRIPKASSLVAPAVPLLALPLLAALAGCGPNKQVAAPIVNIPAPIPENKPLEPPPPPPPELINQSKGEDLWHLRSGLNVAVLMCQGPDNRALVASYNHVLTMHKPLLSQAAQLEVNHFQARGGKKWQDAYDDHMTKVYNSYAGTLTRDAFCAKSKTILADAEAGDANAFNDKATFMLWELNKAAGLPDPDGKLARAALAPPLPMLPTAATRSAAASPLASGGGGTTR
ncbi:hypothetical protein [Sphingobium nicotianae]|uniref:Uncharacterized protein n=1 Tax=Sphingobium nicotianae TaxID=2782607 RepID=A0A9X1IRU6_9SPHN|nr:hypothetical protein [Sphingobium nicotianae]MBT2187861.1 hypothetical protein [Sphingobium nicotianae]